MLDSMFMAVVSKYLYDWSQLPKVVLLKNDVKAKVTGIYGAWAFTGRVYTGFSGSSTWVKNTRCHDNIIIR